MLEYLKSVTHGRTCVHILYSLLQELYFQSRYPAGSVNCPLSPHSMTINAQLKVSDLFQSLPHSTEQTLWRKEDQEGYD